MSESIIVSAGGSATTFDPHPAGQFPAVCIDIVDYGMVKTTWNNEEKTRHRIMLRFFCGEWFKDDAGDDQPFWVDKFFTASLHEKSALRPFLETWRGKKFTPAELEAFDLVALLHAPAYVQVGHNPTPDKVYANLESIMRMPKGQAAPDVPTGYVRVKDRPPRDEDGMEHDGPEEADSTTEPDPLPF